MKRGYERGKGIKQTQRLNVSSEVNVKGNTFWRITGDVEKNEMIMMMLLWVKVEAAGGREIEKMRKKR